MDFEVEAERTIKHGDICVCRMTKQEMRLVRVVELKDHEFLGERCYVESYPDPTVPISLTFGPAYLVGVPPEWLRPITCPMEILAWAAR